MTSPQKPYKKDMDNTAAIESLRSFAVSHNEIQFAHLCTAALAGEEWAVERVIETDDRIAARVRDCGPLSAEEFADEQLRAIRSTDTTRPDGAIARSCAAP